MFINRIYEMYYACQHSSYTISYGYNAICFSFFLQLIKILREFILQITYYLIIIIITLVFYFYKIFILFLNNITTL